MFYNSSYYELVAFTFFLSASIPIVVFIGLGNCMIKTRGYVCKLNSDSEWVEISWTFIPTFVVFVLCFINVQFLTEDDLISNSFDGSQLVKVVGHQWYWSYSDVLFGNQMYDSIITDFVGIVDKPMRLLCETPYKIAVTSADVIHSFALPDFEIKVDAIPGRISNEVIYSERCGVFVGYCSELCGAGHAYMPIVLEIVPKGL
uniref:Cytochrome c oxidase subunit 2 n=1 Tax=Posthodiplostomum centrarchi TaxID=1954244 RepID=A0A6J3YMN3_9TREM|nr:cytochrome c oxidase subunit II [Posthodiplostomum centrarchi]